MNKTVVVRCSTNFLLCSDLPILLLLQVILKCNVNDSSFVISQVYNMVLITICTYYAVLTRKVTMNWILAFAICITKILKSNFYDIRISLEVESNRIEWISDYNSPSNQSNHKFSNRTNFERIQRLKNLSPPYSWSQIERISD